jgi:hypothetical protein
VPVLFPAVNRLYILNTFCPFTWWVSDKPNPGASRIKTAPVFPGSHPDYLLNNTVAGGQACFTGKFQFTAMCAARMKKTAPISPAKVIDQGASCDEIQPAGKCLSSDIL